MMTMCMGSMICKPLNSRAEGNLCLMFSSGPGWISDYQRQRHRNEQRGLDDRNTIIVVMQPIIYFGRVRKDSKGKALARIAY
jgi:hypothetical protein